MPKKSRAITWQRCGLSCKTEQCHERRSFKPDRLSTARISDRRHCGRWQRRHGNRSMDRIDESLRCHPVGGVSNWPEHGQRRVVTAACHSVAVPARLRPASCGGTGVRPARAAGTCGQPGWIASGTGLCPDREPAATSIGIKENESERSSNDEQSVVEANWCRSERGPSADRSCTCSRKAPIDRCDMRRLSWRQRCFHGFHISRPGWPIVPLPCCADPGFQRSYACRPTCQIHHVGNGSHDTRQ